MHLWHLTPDMPRDPRRGSAGDWVSVELGTSPIESGQTVWLTLRADGASGATRESRVASVWQRNDGINSYWHAEIGPFADGDSVRYAAHGSGPASAVDGPKGEFRVGPKRYLAILSHQHQPLYRDLAAPSPRGGYGQPWVRLHAIRDYYSMSHLVAQHPAIRLTINLTPVLLEQILEYVDHGATDAAVDLTRTLAGRLTPTASEIVLATFFDAHWHNQIFPHARYDEDSPRDHPDPPAAPRRGQLEIATTPFYHPILPLLLDTDGAIGDRPGTTLRDQFAHPGGSAVVKKSTSSRSIRPNQRGRRTIEDVLPGVDAPPQNRGVASLDDARSRGFGDRAAASHRYSSRARTRPGVSVASHRDDLHAKAAHTLARSARQQVRAGNERNGR